MSKFYLLLSLIFCNVVSSKEHFNELLQKGIIFSLDEEHFKENAQIGQMFTSSLYSAIIETRWVLAPVLLSSKEVRAHYSKFVLFLIGAIYNVGVSTFDILFVPRIKLYYYKKALQRALQRKEQEVVVD